MARWRNRWALLAGGLASLTSWLTPAWAQGPVSGPLMTSYAPQPEGHSSDPATVDYHGPSGAFVDGDTVAVAEPYFLRFRGEYMLWNLSNPRINSVLATTATNPNLQNGVGAIADPGTVSLLGPESFSYHAASGARVTAGFAPGWFIPFEISGFWLNPGSVTLLNVSSDGSATAPVLSRPFQAPNLPSLNGLGQQVVLTAGFPGLFAGSINATADLSLWGFETNFLFNVGASDVVSLDLILGYRYADLSENLHIANTLQSVNAGTNIAFNSVNPAGLPPGFTSVAADNFLTRNQFNGATVGVRPSLYLGQFSFLTDLKLSVGATRQTLNINGLSTLYSPDGSVQNASGGLLAVGSNSGITAQNAFTIIPEANFNVGFNLNRNIRFFATYNIFFWSQVVRPGDQLNTRVDSRQVPTDFGFDPSAQPANPLRSSFATTNFWGQGLSVGLEIGF